MLGLIEFVILIVIVFFVWTTCKALLATICYYYGYNRARRILAKASTNGTYAAVLAELEKGNIETAERIAYSTH